MPKVWFITGASGGFGKAIADAAGSRGDQVVATARSVESVSDYEHHFRLDVTDPEQVAIAVDETIRRLGRIDLLVNNAGHGLVGVAEELADSDLTRLLETNLIGAHRVARAVLPHMRTRGSGHIIQMSSVGGVVGNPGHAAYATSKFALEGLSEAMAGEVAPWGLNVTIVEPGPFRTDFAGRSLEMVEPLSAYADTPGGALRAGFRDQDQNQPNDPARAAAAVLAVVDAPQPPLRLPLGPEAVGRIRDKLTRQLAEIDAWESLALDTRYDAEN